MAKIIALDEYRSTRDTLKDFTLDDWERGYEEMDKLNTVENW
ncbi:hypothetical protein [Ammoniphilus resinae]|uniref:Uncharacterized protein n=1 Tax=Ammoniphilus resinae TaxID=861532 RepID=A0ABS4GXQ2_9BACL|nr:hypothetical protein [Ammoniphilus resinae]MBP1935031.1 hypothetical protein [Ammoniphilus resinae]